VRPEVLALATDLSRRGEPFVLATVVWRRAPSSGKEGSTALITPITASAAGSGAPAPNPR
jgi:hypothetical protein